MDDPDEGENHLGAENNIRDDINFCEVYHQEAFIMHYSLLPVSSDQMEGWESVVTDESS